MTAISSIRTTILDIPPSCIEVCPWDQSFFAIGTYHLEKNIKAPNHDTADDTVQPQKRSGSVLIFRLTRDHTSVELLHTQACDYAILDLHFPLLRDDANEHEKCVWTANSTGSLTRHVLLESGTTIEKSAVLQLWEPDNLVLAFTFHATNSDILGVTLSDGSVVLCQIPADASTASMYPLVNISKHDLEAWTMNFDLSGNRCLSGGDDAVLQCSNVKDLAYLSNGVYLGEHIQPTTAWRNRRLHSAGVTAILPLEENTILTGSYDDHLRIISIDRPPKLLAEANLGGGVWRLKLISSRQSANARQYDILASCMHAGARIIQITLQKETEPEIEVLVRFEEHESMNYGSDFVRAKDNGCDYYTILSTSFYDKRLCLWRFRAPDLGGAPATLED